MGNGFLRGCLKTHASDCFRIGGYQVLDKWLKDRKGRKLTFDDLFHWQKIVVALKETMRLMEEIDELIPAWPIE